MLETSDGKKQGVPAGHLERMDRGGSCANSISRVSGGCGSRGPAGPGCVDAAFSCMSLRIILVL